MATPVHNWVGPQHDTMPILLELGVSSQSASLSQPIPGPIPQPMECQSLNQPVLTQPIVQAMPQTMTQPMAHPTPQVLSHPITHQVMTHPIVQGFTHSMMSQPITQAMTQVLTEAVTQADIGKCEMETQTIPEWDHLMKISIQTYLQHKLVPLLETRLRGSKCIHLKGLNFEDLLAMVVERHNALCVHPSVFAEKKQNPKVQQTPVDRFSEVDAAAKVMVDLLNAQHQDILQANKDLNAAMEEGVEEGDMQDGEPKKKIPRKRRDVSTKEELLKKGVKLIRCDPPDHVVNRAKEMWGKKLDRARHIPAKKWYQCADCGLKLEDIHKLGRHITKHSTTRAFECPQCKRMYKTKDAVRKHVKENHTPGFKFKVFCQYCGKGFKSRKHRDDHLTVHTGESAFKCTECGKAFKSKRSVIGHMRTRHKIGKLHYCPLCECHYPFLNLLHSHLQSIHRAQVPQAMQQIFINKCLICDEEFQNEDILMQHMPTHGGQECIGCVRRETRRKNVLDEATKRGLTQEQAKALDFKNLEEWVRDQKVKEGAEKKSRREQIEADIRQKAIAQGMDTEMAVDIKQAREYLSQQKKGLKRRKNEDKMRSKADESPTTSAEVTADDLKLRHCQIKSSKREKRLKNDIEQMEKWKWKRAIDIAVEIIESVEGDEIHDQSVKTLAVVQSELEVLKKQKLSKKSVMEKLGTAIDKILSESNPSLGELELELEDKQRIGHGNEREQVKGVNSNQRDYPDLASDAQLSLDGSVKQSLDLLKDYQNRNAQSLPSTEKRIATNQTKSTTQNPQSDNTSHSSDVNDNDKVKCTVYSQDPKITLGLVKSGQAKFVIDKSGSQEVKGIHLVSVKQGHTNAKIVLSTNAPEKIKEKVTAGKLTLHILPLGGLKLVGLSDKDSLKGKSETGATKDKLSQHLISLTEEESQTNSNLNKTKTKLLSSGPQQGPQISSFEDLKSQGVKLIPCDPPDHVLKKASNNQKSCNRAQKQWYQCEHCEKKMDDVTVTKLKNHVKKCTLTSKPTTDSRQFPDLEPGEIRVGGPIKSISISKSKVRSVKSNVKTSLEPGEIRHEPNSKSQTSDVHVQSLGLESGQIGQAQDSKSTTSRTKSNTCVDNTSMGTGVLPVTSFEGICDLREETREGHTLEEQNHSEATPLSMECVTVSNQVQGESIHVISPGLKVVEVESSNFIATPDREMRSDDVESHVAMEMTDSELDASSLLDKIQKGLT